MERNQVKQESLPEFPEELPCNFTFPGIEDLHVRIEYLRKHHLPKFQTIWEQATSTGDGLSNEELYEFMVENIIKEDVPGYLSIVVIDTSNEEVISAISAFPSNLCRSEKPAYCRSFMIVNKAYRGKKISPVLMHYTGLMLERTGYRGLLARVTVVARSISPSVSVGTVFIGVIPWCSYLEGRGWYHDLIVHEQRIPMPEDASENYVFPMLGHKETLQTSLPIFRRPSPTKELPILSHKVFGKLKIHFADMNAYWDVQDVLRDAAKEGDGFGLDEFTVDGVFNEKHILNCVYWVVTREQDGKMVAAILCGENGHGRSHNIQQAAGVIFVLKEYRRQGLGSQLLQFCEDYSPVLGYSSILIDMLSCNTVGLAMLKKHGYIITGSLPNSCIVKGQKGWTDCYLNWKKLPQPKI